MPYGPAVQSLLKELHQYESNPIIDLNIDCSDLNTDITSMLELVYEKLGQYSAYKLVQMTHNEEPWLNTQQGQEISVTEIKNYFKEHYIS